VSSKPATLPAQNRRPIMPSYSPELIQIMRAALDEVMTKIPVEHATPGIKAHMAELILKAAAEGQTNSDNPVDADVSTRRRSHLAPPAADEL
jgi:hypothetical protein